MQAAVRARVGEGVTAFTRIEDGARSVAVGDVVKLAVRPALMGVVQHFIVHQAWALIPAQNPKQHALGGVGDTFKLAVRPADMAMQHTIVR